MSQTGSVQPQRARGLGSLFNLGVRALPGPGSPGAAGGTSFDSCIKTENSGEPAKTGPGCPFLLTCCRIFLPLGQHRLDTRRSAGARWCRGTTASNPGGRRSTGSAAAGLGRPRAVGAGLAAVAPETGPQRRLAGWPGYRRGRVRPGSAKQCSLRGFRPTVNPARTGACGLGGTLRTWKA